MSDFDDDILNAALTDFRAGTMPRIAPMGAEAVIGTVRRRQRVRTVAAASALALAVLVPSGLLALQDRRAAPAGPGTSAPASIAPTAPSTVPSTSPPSGPPPVLDAPTDLANATFTLPAWPSDAPTDCRSGKITFHGGSAASGDVWSLLVRPGALSADVDGDGGRDTLVRVTCRAGESGFDQLVALSAPDGALHTLGRVVSAEEIVATTPGADGTVAVKVADMVQCCGMPPTHRLTQDRTFRWAGGQFQQVAGPQSFLVDQSYRDALTVGKAEAAVGAPSGGKQTGTVTVTLHNAGPRDIKNVTVMLSFVPAVTVTGKATGASCGSFAGQVSIEAPCSVGTVMAGGSVTFTVPISYSVTSDKPLWPGHFQIRSGDQRYDNWEHLDSAGFQ
ncbi:hypothetical protein [Dactylosporangium salmoneum]|uniref:DUF11 domain-containing protein n=1 Tax=Dactylosporangium salmoneum TaxID=53361 RepID=A0ABP5U525_9ACTN